MKEYAVYLNKTDELLCFGTSRECAEYLGMTLDSFYCMVSRVKSGKNRKYSIVKEEDDEMV